MDILLVEDNPDDEALTLRALSKHRVGNSVVVARDATEALSYLHRTGDHESRPEGLPELVLLDLNLPGGASGLDILREVRANPVTRHLPVIVLTSSQADKDLIESYNLGANAYARKPLHFAELSDAVTALGLFWFIRRPAV